ncbi:AMP-binding enzyme-domain-containing protein, partial [Dunaliella salina]
VSQAASHLRQLLPSQPHAAGCLGLLSPDTCSKEDAPTPEGSGVPLVGLFMEQSLHYISAVLACLAAGCAFMPLDPSWPEARLQSILRTAQPLAILFDGHISSSLEGQRAHLVGSGVAVIDVAQLLSQGAGQGDCSEERRCQRDESQLPLQQQPQQQPQQQQRLMVQQESDGDEPQRRLHGTYRSLPYFCVMFTSGSTGLPAGEEGHPS